MSRKARFTLGALFGAAVLALSLIAAGAGTRVALAVDAIHVYRAFASPVMAKVGVRCRFQPTCSRYAEEAIEKYGVFEGSVKAGRRLLRCTPLT
ncbi:MAG TPA: membrane protein insertion efficiency factor YidD, partial [Vicinamibacterales bacterium]|nr:membrane protein insertion efficiency factor YidD [Vicinamibacterales bacterium]